MHGSLIDLADGPTLVVICVRAFCFCAGDVMCMGLFVVLPDGPSLEVICETVFVFVCFCCCVHGFFSFAYHTGHHLLLYVWFF